MACVFCDIRDGKIPSTKVYEDERTIAFMDINPLNDGHILVVPKAHAENIYEMAEEDIKAVAAAARRLAAALKKALQPEGLTLIQANGKAAGQIIGHFHLHLVPRWLGDGKGLAWELVRGDPERIKPVAEKIVAQLSERQL